MTRVRLPILGAQIDAIAWPEALDTLSQWAAQRESRYVCICNTHSVVTANQDADFMRTINSADMATSDGAPVAWMIGRISGTPQERINGPDLMWKYLARIQHTQESVFFYGSTDATLGNLTNAVTASFPGVRIAGTYSPPFRPLSQAEEEKTVQLINASGAGVVFVGLGCPKQERWMEAHRGRINAVMIGVGAAFDYHAGTIKRAPLWMQRGGLEWLHRLLSEPRRLWKRYLITNSVFIVQAAQQLCRHSLGRKL